MQKGQMPASTLWAVLRVGRRALTLFLLSIHYNMLCSLLCGLHAIVRGQLHDADAAPPLQYRCSLNLLSGRFQSLVRGDCSSL